MRRSFADYAESVLQTLRPPIPPLESYLGRGPLDRWLDVRLPELPRRQAGQEDFENLVVGRRLSEEDYRLIDGAVVEGGTDALAFYKSIRFKDDLPYRGHWGIFLFDSSISFLASEIMEHYPNYDSFRARKHAFQTLKDHETFHFFVDVWALSVEGVSKDSHYETCLNRVYLPMNPGDHVYEEALANAYAFRRSLSHGYSGWLSRFMKEQPGSYSLFAGVDQQTYGNLARQIIHGAGWWLQDPSFEQTPFLANMPNKNVSEEDCPLYILPGVQPSTLYPAGIALPTAAEIRRSFLPAYLHAKEKRRTDHLYVQIDNQATIKVPNDHRGDRLKRSEYNNILFKAGMRKQDFDTARITTNRWRENCPRPVILPPLV